MFFFPDSDDENETDELELYETDYMILDDFDFALVGMSRKKKKKCTHDYSFGQDLNSL